MRSARLVVIGGVVVGVVGLVLVAAVQRDSLAFTLGVARATTVARLGPGQQVCQRPIDVPAGGGFDRVALGVRPASPVRVTVLSASGRTLAAGNVNAGRVRLDRAVSTTPISVCIRNSGATPVGVLGDADLAARTSTAALDGRPLRRDVSLVFEREARSVAAEVPRMLARAALFRFPGMGAGVYVVLALGLVAAGPLMIVRAVGGAVAAPAAPPLRGPRRSEAPRG